MLTMLTTPTYIYQTMVPFKSSVHGVKGSQANCLTEMRLLLTFTVVVAAGIAHGYVIDAEVEGARERRSPQTSYGRDAGGGVITHREASRRFGTPDGSVDGHVSSYVDRVDGGAHDGYREAGGSAFVSASF